jgi:hypothetical protein
VIAPAPYIPPPLLETAYVEARVLAVRAPDPIDVLAGPSTAAQKLSAIDALHRSLPNAPQARRAKGLEALRRACSDPDARVRAAALAHLGYAVPVVGDAAAREAAVHALIGALWTADRVHALRGLSSASHDLPPSVEAGFQTALLDLLDLTLTAEERVTALLALDGFVRAREDLPARRPELVAAVETRVLAPIEADPAAFVAGTERSARSLTCALIWHAARHSHSAGSSAALKRVNALFALLLAAETDAAVRAELESYLAAPAPVIL